MNDTKMKSAVADGRPGGASLPEKLERLAVGVITTASPNRNPRQCFSGEVWDDFVRNIALHGVQQALIVRTLAKYELDEPDLVNKFWRITGGQYGKLPLNFTGGDAEGNARKKLAELNGDGEQFELVCGERRWRAALATGDKGERKRLGIETAPQLSAPCIVRGYSDREALECQALENLQRADLSPLEEARGYETLRIGLGMTVPQICERLNKKPKCVYAKLALLRTDPLILRAVDEGTLLISVAELIGRVHGAKLQNKALRMLMPQWEGGEPVSYRLAQRKLRDELMVDLKGAPFDLTKAYACAGTKGISDAALAAITGPCGVCSHRSGNCRDTYPEIKEQNVCTLPECFGLKKEAHAAEALAGFKAKGLKVLSAKETESLWCYSDDEPGGNYVKAASECPWDKKGRTIGQVLGEKAPPVVVALHQGKPVKLMEKKALQTVLVAEGLVDAEGKSSSYKEEQAEREARKELRKKVAAQAVPLILAAAAKDSVKAVALRILTARREEFAKAGSLKDGEFCAAAVRLFECGSPTQWDGEWDKDFACAAKVYGVDLNGLEKRCKEEGARGPEIEKGKSKIANLKWWKGKAR